MTFPKAGALSKGLEPTCLTSSLRKQRETAGPGAIKHSEVRDRAFWQGSPWCAGGTELKDRLPRSPQGRLHSPGWRPCYLFPGQSSSPSLWGAPSLPLSIHQFGGWALARLSQRDSTAPAGPWDRPRRGRGRQGILLRLRGRDSHWWSCRGRLSSWTELPGKGAGGGEGPYS